MKTSTTPLPGLSWLPRWRVSRWARKRKTAPTTTATCLRTSRRASWTTRVRPTTHPSQPTTHPRKATLHRPRPARYLPVKRACRPTEGDDSSAEAREDEADAEDARDATDGVSPPASVSDIEGAGEPDTDAAYGVTAAEEERPLIGPDALVALSEFRQEGVATLPEELVLDLGDATTPEERDRLLAAALAHVEMQDAIYRVPLESGASRRWKGLIASAVFLFAIVLVGLPPAFLVPEAPPPLTVAETGGGIRMALLMQAEQIEAFRARSGRLPSSIAEVETALPGVRYVRSSNRLYQLIAYTPAGDAVIYDSSSPDPSFAAAEEAWSRLIGDS